MEQTGIMQDRTYTQAWWTRLGKHSYAPPPQASDPGIGLAWHDGWTDADRRVRSEAERTEALARDSRPYRPDAVF